MILSTLLKRRPETASPMRYRRLGRSGIMVSAVGFGTCQLRLVPEQQAIDTLKRGFELGVNCVHTAPDYEGADELVAQAVAESGRKVTVFTQGYGEPSHFEWLFETACARVRSRRLDVFGIACIEDREYLGENVWGPGGVVEFLLEKKRQGRLGAIFCESHGAPDYICGLVESGVFDAILLAYNTIGFHTLSYYPEGGSKTFENLPRNHSEVFPLARRHGVGIMIMKPLGGGLMCPGKAFPAYHRFSAEAEPLAAGEVLRQLLMEPDISCVMPGTASMEEAEENARAGHAAPALAPARLDTIDRSSAEMIASLCSRCGHCDALCSRQLPVSWLFRDTYVAHQRAEAFETIDRLQYFHLHPDPVPACTRCEDQSCRCPAGLDIPGSLVAAHVRMLELCERGLLPLTPGELALQAPQGSCSALIVRRELPPRLDPGESATARLWLENAGAVTWKRPRGHRERGLVLDVDWGGSRSHIGLRHDVEPGTRTHFSFEIRAPRRAGTFLLSCRLRDSGQKGATGEPPLLEAEIEVRP